MSRLCKILTRKKALDPVSLEETQLNRVLNTFDLTALGVGSTLGVGVYVLTGQVAKDIAGPSVILSFLIAAIASVFAALCYAEFGARAPRAGSAYIYSYVCVGELVAFVIGWNLILEYVIGSASVARGLSGYLDTLINNTLENTFIHIAPINVNYMSPYFDFFAFGISVLLAVLPIALNHLKFTGLHQESFIEAQSSLGLYFFCQFRRQLDMQRQQTFKGYLDVYIALAIGVKESSIVNNIVTVLNVGVVLFVIVAGSFKADVSNWEVQPNASDSSNSTTNNIGQGGFFPFGVEGMIKGAAKCFYAFVGFDAIATTGEEVINPKRAIPISILVSLFISFCAYFGTSTVLTLMVPYYLQDKNAPLPVAFEDVGWGWAKWVVAVGAMFGLCASLFGAMFPLPRIIFAMGSDGLVFKFLAKVHSKFKTPFIGTILAGLLTGFMAALFKLEHLVNMMSIGTLLAYTIVAASVLLLRYAEEKKPTYTSVKTTSESDCESISSSDGSESEKYSEDYGKRSIEGINSDERDLIIDDPVVGSKFWHIFNCYRQRSPTKFSEKVVAIEVLLYCLLCVLIGLAGRFLIEDIKQGEVWAIASASVAVGLAVILVIMIVMQPVSNKELSFRVPLVPLIPALSILVNIYLMMMLDAPTWIRFGVWMAIGIPMYIYCVCDYGKSISEAQVQKLAVSESTSSTLKLSNGVSNRAFIHETNGFVMPSKKGKAPLPPSLSPTSEKSESIEIQQQAAIAQLDEILDKEVAIAHLDDILESETVKLNEHRLSDGTSSNMSAVVSRKEDVVVDVHCDNVFVTPLDYPHPDNAPIVADFDDSHQGKQVSEDEGINMSLSDENIADNIEDSRIIDETNIEPAMPVETHEDLDNQSKKAVLFDFTVPEQDASSADNIMINDLEIQDVLTDSRKSEATDKPFKEEPPLTPHTPTEAALKSVTLRKVKKELRNLDPHLQEPTASETNLRVGSQGYQQFRDNLNNKLKRMTMIPSFVPIPKKDIDSIPQKFEPNENVIEEHIDKNDAMVKLKNFLDSQTDNEVENQDAILKPTKRFLATEERSKSVDGTLFESDEFPPKLNKVEEIFQKLDNNGKIKSTKDVLESESRGNELNSINSEQFDSVDSKHLKRRLSKSLGSSFLRENDETVHRRNMGDIFGSIKALRKSGLPHRKNMDAVFESIKASDNVKGFSIYGLYGLPNSFKSYQREYERID